MSEGVQRILEGMVPELEDLTTKQLFSKPEIDSILAQRSQFEYRLASRAPQPRDYLDYIAYEENVERLRVKRKHRQVQALKDAKRAERRAQTNAAKKSKLSQSHFDIKQMSALHKASVSDYAGIKRISFLYQRMVRKHSHRIDLWLAAIEHAQATRAHRQLSQLFASALALHTHSTDLWRRAIIHEYTVNHSHEAARVLCQRALRFCQSRIELWQLMCALEIDLIITWAERQRVLGINAGSAQTVEGTEVEHLDLRFKIGESTSAKDSVESMRADHTAQAMLRALLPQVVFKNACIALQQAHADTHTPQQLIEQRLSFLALVPHPHNAYYSVETDRQSTDEQDDMKQQMLTHNLDKARSFLHHNYSTDPTQRYLCPVDFDALIDGVYQSIDADFDESKHAETWQCRATRIMRECEAKTARITDDAAIAQLESDAVLRAIAVYEAAIAKLQTTQMYQMFIEFLHEQAADLDPEQDEDSQSVPANPHRQRLMTLCQATFEKSPQLLSIRSIRLYAESLMTSLQLQQCITLLQKFTTSSPNIDSRDASQSKELLSLHALLLHIMIQQSMLPPDASTSIVNETTIQQQFNRSRSQCTSLAVSPCVLWRCMIEWRTQQMRSHAQRDELSVSAVTYLYVEACLAMQKIAPSLPQAATDRYELMIELIDHLTATAETPQHVPQLLTQQLYALSPLSLSVFKQLIHRLDQSEQYANTTAQQQAVRQVCERMLSELGTSSASAWIVAMRYELHQQSTDSSSMQRISRLQDRAKLALAHDAHQSHHLQQRVSKLLQADSTQMS